MTDRYADILDYIRSIRLVSSHNHHLNDGLYEGIGLRFLLENSYVGWVKMPPDFEDAEAWDGYLKRYGTNSFFRWLFTALEKIYGIPVRPDTVAELDRAVRRAYSDPEHHLRLLREDCRYDAVINERQPHPGDDLGHPELFRPSFRCDCFFSGWLADKPEPNGFFARSLFEREVLSVRDYLDQMRSAIEKKKAEGCVALKVAIAYERPIVFENTDLAAAEKALNNPQASESDVIAFGDVVMHEIAEIAADTGLPLQIHTGTGQYEKTNPIGLLGLIKAHPNTKFHLLHGGFPWVDDTYALLLATPNVWSDTCWIPYLSTHAARDYLLTALEVADTHRLTWGCDTWMPEDSVGALMAMEQVLASTLNGMINDGAIDFSYACYIAKRILSDNAKELFAL
ncbi:MAG: amidohydrolase family protein [Clostridia bacterium]|nr:amidohydrolase family protein [Clostridia bacterium]